MAKAKVTFESEICKGCGLCVSACPKKIINLDSRVINNKGYEPAYIEEMDKCIACANCAIICPDSAIKVERL
jgi:2-oxoglutarate ferredoxin oxidoreductase subunit delta